MKNYELIQKLMQYPAGAVVYFGQTVTEEDVAGREVAFLEREVMDVDTNKISITLMG